jgi:hypothetical protein
MEHRMNAIFTQGYCKSVRNRLAVPLVLATLWGFTGTAHALPIIGSPTGLAGATDTITFSEGTTVDNQTITNEFAAFGATFQNFGIDKDNQFTIVGSTGFVGDYLAAGIDPDFPQPQPHIINFNNIVTGATFATVDAGNTWLIEALSGGSVVESFSTVIDSIPGSGFMGFTGISFDSIRLTTDSETAALAIDTLQFNDSQSGVPAPATLALFGIGLVSLGWSRRRARVD